MKEYIAVFGEENDLIVLNFNRTDFGKKVCDCWMCCKLDLLDVHPDNRKNLDTFTPEQLSFYKKVS